MLTHKLVNTDPADLTIPEEAPLEPVVNVPLTEAPDGYRLTAHDPAFEEQTVTAQRIMEKRRDLLSTLAK